MRSEALTYIFKKVSSRIKLVCMLLKDWNVCVWNGASPRGVFQKCDCSGCLCCTVLLSPDGLFSDRAMRYNSTAYITHRRGILGGEAGFKTNKQTKSLASLSCCIPSHWQKISCECWCAAFARPFLKPPAGASSRGWDSFPVFPRAWHQLESFKGRMWWQSGSTISPAAFITPCHSEPPWDLLFWWNVTRNHDKRRGAFLNPGKIVGKNAKKFKCKGICLIKFSPVRSTLKDRNTFYFDLFAFFFLI